MDRSLVQVFGARVVRPLRATMDAGEEKSPATDKSVDDTRWMIQQVRMRIAAGSVGGAMRMTKMAMDRSNVPEEATGRNSATEKAWLRCRQ